MRKKALIVASGGLRGAYSAGVLTTLCRILGNDYFNTIYASSVGTYTSTFFVSGQPDTIEDVWRNFVDGNKFVSFFNPLIGKEILDFDYLTHLFKTSHALDVPALFRSKTSLKYVLTECTTGEVHYHSPELNNLFDLMSASAALPLAHRPVNIDGVCYFDGGLGDPLPIEKALRDGFEDILVVSNKPEGFYIHTLYKILNYIMAPLSRALISPACGQLILTLEPRLRAIDVLLSKNTHVKVIRPSAQLPFWSILDTNKEHINRSFDLGVKDTKHFLRTHVV